MSHKLNILLLFTVTTTLQIGICYGKINITNSWTLPGLGFPVFYRYFRDKITWYEADAVCQFHHANLATVNNGAQFDAVRSFLKEIDISDSVWIGLTRPEDSDQFKWTNHKDNDLSTPYWAEELPVGEGSLCAALDPAHDYRWHALRCGGPATAAFLCELKVPEWAFKCTTNSHSTITFYDSESGNIHLSHVCDNKIPREAICSVTTTLYQINRQLDCNPVELSPLSPELEAEFEAFLEPKPTKNRKKETFKKLTETNKKYSKIPKLVSDIMENEDELMQGDEPAKLEMSSIILTSTEVTSTETVSSSVSAPSSSVSVSDETESPFTYYTEFTDYSFPEDRTKRETIMESSTVSMTLPNGVKKHSTNKHDFDKYDYSRQKGRKYGKSNPQLYSPQVMRKEFSRPAISNITTQTSDDKKQSTGDMFVPPMLLVKSNFPHHTLEYRPFTTAEQHKPTEPAYIDSTFDSFENDTATEDVLIENVTDNTTVAATSSHNTHIDTTVIITTTETHALNTTRNNTAVSDGVSPAPTTPAPITVPEKLSKSHTEALRSVTKKEETSAENHVDHNHNHENLEHNLNGEDEEPYKPNRHRILTPAPASNYIKKVLG